MTRRKKLVFVGLGLLLLLAQGSWVALSWREEPWLPLARKLLGLLPLLVLDAVVLSAGALLLRASLGRKRLALALAVLALPLAFRLVAGRSAEGRRVSGTAQVRARIDAERKRLALAPRPTAGPAKDADAGLAYLRLLADDHGLTELAPELRRVTEPGPVRLRLARKLDAETALLAALHDAVSGARCDGALLEDAPELLAHHDRFERLFQLLLAEGHRHAERGALGLARASYLAALRLATDLAGVRVGTCLAEGRALEVRALQALFRLATEPGSSAASGSDAERAALVRDLERFEPAIHSPANAGELEGQESLLAFLSAWDVIGLTLPWDEESLLRAHFYWFLPAASGIVHELPRAERLAQLGDEWAQATDERSRLDVEALAEEVERSCSAPACAAFPWKGSARWDELALARLVRGAALAESRRTADGCYPGALGDDAPEDPFAPGTRIAYTVAPDLRSYRVASRGLESPLAAHERAPAAALLAAPLPPGAIAALDSEAKAPISAVAFAKDGAVLVAASPRGVRLVDGTSGSLRAATLRVVARLGVSPRALAVSPDGRELLVAEGRSVSRWDLATGAERDDFLAGASPVSALALAPGGKLLAVSVESFEGDVVRLLAPTGECLRELGRPVEQILSLAFSPGGELLAVGSSNQPLALFDVAKGVALAPVPPPASVLAVAFAPDGRTIAAAVGKEARLADLASRRPLGVLPTSAVVTGLAWSPDGKLLATSGADGSVRLWDVAQLEEIVAWKGHVGRVNALAFAPDGKSLASGGSDGVVYLWDASWKPR